MEDQRITSVMPGQDSNLHAQTMQTKVNDALTDLYGEKITEGSLAPAVQVNPLEHDESHLSEPAGHELEFNQIVETIQGTHKTAPAKNFLHTLIDKLKKQNSQEDIA